MAWRQLIAGNMGADIARERANPLNQVIGDLLKQAQGIGKEKREEAAGARQLARQSIYQNSPKTAAAELGIELPTTGEPTAPPGMKPKEAVVDEYGNTKYSYEAPEQVDEALFIKEYNKYVAAVENANAFLPADKKIEIPSYTEWRERFPVDSNVTSADSGVPEPTGAPSGPGIREDVVHQRIRVRRKSDGQEGTIEAWEFDNNLYEIM